ncbi:hypothetical protein HMPREF9056_00870 [Actinomyces sp. oral taxon 170 str. F0386]|nr:hypothetical protein HMPREF9056_00870 [Actinomyces sp. oral taxon 170 str. F0386]
MARIHLGWTRSRLWARALRSGGARPPQVDGLAVAGGSSGGSE